MSHYLGPVGCCGDEEIDESEYGVMGDGAVRFINDTINQSTFEAITTTNGGETIDF